MNLCRRKGFLQVALFSMHFSIFASLTATSQSLSVKGRIIGTIRNDRNELLSSATVMINDISLKSNINGVYEADLLPGTYTITVSYTGLESKQITEVVIRKGEVLTQDIVLSLPANTEAAVIVTASARRESVGSLFRIQKNNMAVSDGISIEQIRRTPDNNVAQSLRRINGVTVMDNKFVVVRGMGERYNNVLLNGSQLPSTEANKKNFSFDLLPSALIDNIVVNKTATPDLTAEFAGGVVQVTTKEVPEKNLLFISAGTGMNTNSTFNDFRSTVISKSEYFGKFDNNRYWFSNTWDPLTYFRLRTSSTGTKEAYNLNSRIPNTYGLYVYKAAPLQEYQLNAGFRKRFKNNSSAGIILASTYRNEQLIEDFSRATEFGDSIAGKKYHLATSIGGLLSVSYNTGSNKISFKNIYSRRLSHENFVFSGRDANANYTENYGSFLHINSMLQNRIEGEHAAGKNGFRFKWYGDRSATDRQQPDTRTTKYFKQTGDQGKPSIDLTSPLNPGLGGLYSSKLMETRYGWGTDFTVPLEIFGKLQKIKLGYSGSERTADFSAVFLRPILVDNSSANSSEYYGLPDYEIFTSENFRKGIFTLNPITTTKQSDADAYSGKQRLTAAYGMADLQLPLNIRLTGGIRMEDYNIAVNNILGRDSSGKINKDTVTGIKETRFFPSVNLVYSLNARSNIRFAWSKTIARFDFREVASLEYYDFSLPGVIFGNPTIRNTIIKNIDLRYEFYPAGNEIITASVFYKHFKDPIEVLQMPNASGIYSYYNFNQMSSENLGFEIDARKSFAFFNRNSSFLKNLYISGNFSYMKSEVSIDKNALGKFFAGITGAPSVDTAKKDSRNRALQGLSPYSVNAGLLYQGKAAGFNIAYNRFGRRLVFAGLESQLDYFEHPRDVIDVQVYGRLLKRRLELKLNLSDILNQEFIQYNNSNFARGIATPNDDPKGDAFNEQKDFVLYRARRGIGISFSMSYRL